jgi:hypothetical protein
MGVGGQLHAPAALPPGKRPGTYCIGGWVGPRAGLDGCEKSRPHRDFFFLILTSPSRTCGPKDTWTCSCWTFPFLGAIIDSQSSQHDENVESGWDSIPGPSSP